MSPRRPHTGFAFPPFGSGGEISLDRPASDAPAPRTAQEVRGVPGFHDVTKPGWHGLWVDADGNLRDAHRPRPDGSRAVWRRWFGKGSHPVFGIAGSGNLWSIFQSPDDQTGDVLLAWYSSGKLGDDPSWLMLRERQDGDLWYSIWYPRHTSQKPQRTPSRAPVEKQIAPGALDQIESTFGLSAAFSGLSEGFRRAWAKRHKTVVQKSFRGTTVEDPSVTDFLGTSLGTIGKEAGQAGAKVAGDLGQGLLSGFLGTTSGKVFAGVVVAAGGLFLLLRFGKR